MNTSSTRFLLLHVGHDANAEDDTVRISRIALERSDGDPEPLPDTEPSPTLTPRSCTRETRRVIVRR